MKDPMSLLTDLFTGRKKRIDQVLRDLAEGPDRFFYVREWACRPGATPEEAARALALVDGEPMTFAAGIAEIERAPDRVFIAPYAGAAFLFAQQIGLGDLHQRLSRTGSGAAYAVFLDDKRYNILCSRAVAGQTVRELALNDDGFSQEGAAAANEPPFHSADDLSGPSVLALAATWGPDPRALIGAAPPGWLYSTARR